MTETKLIDMSDVFEEKPSLYSKKAIRIWTIFFSPFFGDILMGYNLRAVGKKQWAAAMIVLGAIWTYGFAGLASSFSKNSSSGIIVANIVGSMILTRFVWDKFLGKEVDYEARPAWKPVLLFFIICAALIGLGFWMEGHRRFIGCANH